MAQLRDTIVSGSLRATDTLYSTTAQFSILRAPTSSGGTTFGPGTTNNLLKSNGTSVYWTTLAASDIPNLSTDKLTSGTLGVARGGTGAASFTANSVIISGNTTTAALTTRAIYNRTTKGNLEWTAATTDTHIITKNTLAYWDGSYSGTSSNLTYCVKGAFGNAVTYGVDDATANGALGTGTGLTTERSVYYGLVTVNNASQTRATSIYAPTSAGTANQILVSAGGTSAPTWKATANGAAYATSANGALTFGTLPVAQGGTGVTSVANTQAGKDGDGNTISSTYLKLSGGTLTGALTTANNTWNTMGDDAYFGDINKAGHIGIKGKNGNTGLFFVTYNQSSNTTGGAITWDGSKFTITGTVATNISGSSGSCTGNAATATALTSNAGGTEQPIYFSSGKPVATSYALKAAVNAGVNYFLAEYGSNGRALSSGGLLRITGISHATVTPGYTGGGEQYYKAAIKYIAENYPNAANLIGLLTPNAQGPFIGNIYSVSEKDSSTGLPRYSTFIFHNLGGGLESFGTNNYNYYHRTYLSDNNYTNYTVTKTGSGASGTWGISITGNANTATSSQYLMNRGGTTVTIADSTWGIQITPSGHTNRATVWHQKWTQSGLTYTPSGGSATTVSDSADLKYWLSSSNTSNVLQLNIQIDGVIYSLGGFQGNLIGNCSGSSGSCTGNAATATKLSANALNTTASFWRGDNTWSNQLANHIFNTTDIPEGATNLSQTATAHKMTFYRNGFTIPYQMDNTNDGGILRVRGTSESNCIFELGTWDDSGSGETIQFNYYPTTSQVTPTYSVSVPKASGTICLTNGTGASGTWGINVTGSAGSVAWANVTGKPNRAGSDSDGGPAQTVKGAYTSNGGQQNPNYFGTKKVGFLMMNTPVNNNSNYKDWIIMDCYSGNDVDGGVAFGVNRQALGAYIMRSAAARTSWAESAELIGTHNYTSYTVTKTGSGASGTWPISVTGSAADVTGVVSVAHGGTGTSSAGATALSNLGLQYSQISITFNSLGYALYTFEGNTLVVGYNVVGDTAEIDMYRGQGYTGYIFTDRAYRHFKDGLYPTSASVKTGGTYLIDIYYMAYV